MNAKNLQDESVGKDTHMDLDLDMWITHNKTKVKTKQLFGKKVVKKNRARYALLLTKLKVQIKKIKECYHKIHPVTGFQCAHKVYKNRH